MTKEQIRDSIAQRPFRPFKIRLPDGLEIESGIGGTVLEGLKEKGQKLAPIGAFGACNAVGRSADGKGFVGASDPRVPGLAEGL